MFENHLTTVHKKVKDHVSSKLIFGELGRALEDKDKNENHNIDVFLKHVYGYGIEQSCLTNQFSQLQK